MRAPRRLRVALITTHPPDRGNLAEYGSYLCRALGRCEGIEQVHVLANQVASAPAREVLAENVTLHRVWRLGSSSSILRLVEHARALRPDIVQVNAGIRTWGVGRGESLVGASLAGLLRVAGLTTVATLHTIGDTVRLDQHGVGLLTRMGMKLASALYLRAHLVTVTLASMQHALQEGFGATNVAHVPHGTFGPRVAEPPRVLRPRILSFGFWGAFKDADLLVNATAALRQRGVPAELVLGGGPHPYFPNIYSELKRRYTRHDWVTFTGYVPEEKLTELFTSAAVVVLPYRTNAGASGVLNLCRSYGRPVVVSNEPGLLEQLRHEGGAGMVFDGQAGLEHALHTVLSNPKLSREMGEANLEIAHRLTIDTQAAVMARLFQELASGSRVEVRPSGEVRFGSQVEPDLSEHAVAFRWPSPLLPKEPGPAPQPPEPREPREPRAVPPAKDLRV